MRSSRISGLIVSLVTLTAPAFGQESADAVAPEGATDGQVQVLTENLVASLDAKIAGIPVQSDNWMVVAANPLAVEAGAQVLRAGGSAADAMVAVQVV
ncbi:MAG: gamma-glutamyltransferase, partial [Pseudomonadota bacterium]